ncbi:MAG: transcriptional regulator, AraC family [Paenibacillaceae bacterium]|jgi:AraC-like DNA-binding protein|nr:transcriptional regulator, AraC family [Paenibacillaceae bacterium]
MRNRWFYRLMLKFLPVFILIVSTICIVFLLVLTEISRQESEKASLTHAQQISAAVDSILSSIDQQAVYELLINRSFHQFLDSTGVGNHYLNYEVASRLKGLITLTNMHSAYLYRRQDQTVITASGVLSLEGFSDRAFLEEVASLPVRDGWSNPRECPDLAGTNSIRVLTLVKQVPTGLGSQGMLVLNISLYGIQNLFREVSQSKLVEYSLLDRTGKPFYESAGSSLGRGQKLYVSDKTGFTVMGQYRYAQSVGFMKRLTEIWPWIVIGIAVLGVLLLLLVIRRSTRPIDAIVERIKTYSVKKSQLLASGKNEFQFIESALDRLVEQSQQYEREAEEGQRYKKRQFFLEVLEGSFKPDSMNWELIFANAGLSTAYGKLAAVIFEIDHFSDFSAHFNQRDQYLLKFALDNVIAECAKAYGLNTWTEWVNENQVAAMAQTQTDREDSPHAAIEGWSGHVRQWVEEHLKFTVTVGVGECVDKLEELALSYESSASALKYKSTLGTNRVIGYWSLEQSGSKELFDQVAQIRFIAHQYCSGDGSWEEELGRTLNNLKSMLLSRSELVNLFHYLQYHLFARIREMPEEYQKVWQEHVEAGLGRVIAGFETLEELENGLMNVLRSGALRFEELRMSRKVHDRMAEVRQYIHDQLSDPNLSLQAVSDHFGMTLSMASRLFKNEFGEKFVDYLVRMRMESAKRLLTETELPIQDIAAQIGYNHTFSFIRAFKKLEAITPGDYRKKDTE